MVYDLIFMVALIEFYKGVGLILVWRKEMKVKNVPNTSDLHCVGCESWLAHYEKYSGKHKDCSVKGCKKEGKHGAHVRKEDSTDSKIYIVPLCEEHNNFNNTDVMELEKDVKPVLADECSGNRKCRHCLNIIVKSSPKCPFCLKELK